MENASKALIMAAGVLIGIMILSLAVYLFATFGAASAEMHGQIETNRINEFNTQFTSYVGKNNITIYDIITVVNLAKDNNENYNLTEATNNNYYISVNANLQSGAEINLEKRNSQYIQDLIKKETSIDKLKDYIDENGTQYKGLYTYDCSVTINQNTQRVNSVKFTKKN